MNGSRRDKQRRVATSATLLAPSTYRAGRRAKLRRPVRRRLPFDPDTAAGPLTTCKHVNLTDGDVASTVLYNDVHEKNLVKLPATPLWMRPLSASTAAPAPWRRFRSEASETGAARQARHCGVCAREKWRRQGGHLRTTSGTSALADGYTQ